VVYSVGYQAKSMTHTPPTYLPEWVASSRTQTFIQLPAAALGQEMPVLHLRPADGSEPILTNYRVHDHLLRVDRVLGPGEVFQLRVGTEDHGLVVIERNGSTATVSCPGGAICETLRLPNRRVQGRGA
jgi:hypothetical protein